ncbi:unnamed protein product [Prunus armeniaca]
MDLKTLNLMSFRSMVELMMNLASLSSLALVQYAMSLMVYPPWMLVLDRMMRFDEELRDNTKMKVTDFMKTVRKHYAIDVTEAQVYKAKSFAKIRIQVSIEEKYGKGENPMFKRIYLCFGALKKGFVEGCRPVWVLMGAMLRLKTQRLRVVSLTYSFKMLVFKMAMGEFSLLISKKPRLWAATMATTLPVFEAEIVQMLGQSKAAYKWLEERPAAH